jgi:hypothetical protein
VDDDVMSGARSIVARWTRHELHRPKLRDMSLKKQRWLKENRTPSGGRKTGRSGIPERLKSSCQKTCVLYADKTSHPNGACAGQDSSAKKKDPGVVPSPFY